MNAHDDRMMQPFRPCARKHDFTIARTPHRILRDSADGMLVFLGLAIAIGAPGHAGMAAFLAQAAIGIGVLAAAVVRARRRDAII